MLIEKDLALGLKNHVEQNIIEGKDWVVYDSDNPITSKHEVRFFYDMEEAEKEAREYQQIFNWHIAIPAKDMLYQLDEIIIGRPEYLTGETLSNLDTMNLNNLADIKDEAKKLGLSEETINEIEKGMREGITYLTPHERRNGGKNDYIVTPHIKQSARSEFYYFNRFEIVKSVFPPLQEGQKYIVIGEKNEDGKVPTVKFDDMKQAIENFKKRETVAELVVGKDVAHATKLASMEDGKINYVAPDFKQAMFNPPLPQTFWVEQGNSFTVEQGVNMLEGRAVYRDDLLGIDGVPYKAWVILDTEKPRDRSNNLVYRKFNDPNYGFDLKKNLSEYNIKDLKKEEKAEELYTEIKNGNRALVTAEKEDGKEVKVFVTAHIRFHKINFQDLDGNTEKREQFQKEKNIENENTIQQSNSREVAQGQAMGT